jgi:hypothetical protein
MRKRLEGELQRDLAKQKLALEKSAQEQASKQVTAVTEERDKMAVKVKEADAREALIRKEAAETTAKQIASVVKERDQLTAKIKLQEESAKTVRSQAQKETERAVKAALDEAERKRQKELVDQKVILIKDRDQTILKERAGFTRERESWEKKVKELDRKLQRKTAQEMGDGAEIDLYEVLRAQFPGDKIVRIKKGQPGADIHHEAQYKGESCGRIVIDSKNRQAWQTAFVSKLRQDQSEASAEHAVLSTTVFPSGKKELCIESNVIVVSPARACHIIALLRRSMITVHVQGLSMKERAGKMNRLYKLISSEAYAQRFGELARLAGDILDLDVQEKKAHDNVWKKRGAMATRLTHVLREIDTDVSGIIEAREDTEWSAAS